jgi:hypothetical protein
MQTDNHTMKAIKLYLGLDVHKDSITMAIAPAARACRAEVNEGGTVEPRKRLLAIYRSSGQADRTPSGCRLATCPAILSRRSWAKTEASERRRMLCIGACSRFIGVVCSDLVRHPVHI